MTFIKENMKPLKDFLTKARIIEAFEDFVNANGGNYKSFYVGITNDIDTRLYQQHGVDGDKTLHVYDNAGSKSTAQDIEEYFLDKGMQGDTGGGKDDSCFVYCYLITSYTKQ